MQIDFKTSAPFQTDQTNLEDTGQKVQVSILEYRETEEEEEKSEVLIERLTRGIATPKLLIEEESKEEKTLSEDNYEVK